MGSMFTPAVGNEGALADVMARNAKMLAELKELNKHIEWVDAKLYELERIAQGKQ